MQAPSAGERAWLPLESNPDVVSTFSHRMGASPLWKFHDVFGTDPELLAFVPTPVLAVMLLFPVSAAAKQTAAESVAQVNTDGQVLSDKVWFCKQRITNACGTVGVLHALMNADDVEKDGWLKKFAENTEGKDPEACADVLEGDTELDKCHADAAEQGQTRPPALDEVVKLHFVVMIQKDGCLYELDGRKPFPLNLGPSEPGQLLPHAVSTIQERYINKDPTNVNFNILALGPNISM